MATIHLMTGFIGFGKTTLAKQLEKNLPAVRLTHDEFMVKLYGRNIPDADFHPDYDKVDSLLWHLAEQIIKCGADVIMDYGFWSHQSRKKAFTRALQITDDVVFHLHDCDLSTAKERLLQRTKENHDELYISEAEFDTLSQQYEPWDSLDNYPVVLHNLPNDRYIGELVSVKIDRPKGSLHPKHGFAYPINYGFVPFTTSGDGEELDAYVLMEDKPLEKYTGLCIGVIHRTNDNDDKLIVVPEAIDLTDSEIEEAVAFQEKWFKHILLRQCEK